MPALRHHHLTTQRVWQRLRDFEVEHLTFQPRGIGSSREVDNPVALCPAHVFRWVFLGWAFDQYALNRVQSTRADGLNVLFNHPLKMLQAL